MHRTLRLSRRSMLKVAFLSVAFAVCLFLLGRLYQKRSIVDPATIKYLDYEDKYTPKMLKAVPMSERPVGSRMDSVFESGCRDPLEEAQKPRANAAFVVLARNSELDGVLSSIRSLERHFNQWFNYPWIFLNDEVFTDEFKDEVKAATSGKVRFGTVPAIRWHVPAESGDPLFFSEAIEEQGDRGIMYGSMPAYHRMCRFYSGYFFDHYLVRKLDWYWRVEPDVDFYCDITYDPFKEMEAHNKKYGFTIMIKELINTVPNLFRTTVAYAKKNDIKLPDSWSLFSKDLEIARGTNDHLYRDVKDEDQFWKKLQSRVPLYRAMRWSETNEDGIDSHSLKVLADYTNGGGLTNVPADRFDNLEYNLCHFWSNFEIGRTDLFQSKQYRDYFHFLEESNGFFVERWGDAPIHSLALGMFLNQSEIHYFRDIGYRHSTLEHCPVNSINQRPYSEGPRYRHGYSKQEEDYWLKFDSPPSDKDIGTGCRCRCPDDHQEIENSGSSCVSLWAMMSDDERTPKKALDLDRIESEAVNLYEKYLSKHPENGEEWALSRDDIKRLEQFTV